MIQIHFPRRGNQAQFRFVGQTLQPSVLEVAQRLKCYFRIERFAIDPASCGQRCGQIDPAKTDQGVYINVVANFGARLHDGGLGSRQIEQRSNLQTVLLDYVRRLKARQLRYAEK